MSLAEIDGLTVVENLPTKNKVSKIEIGFLSLSTVSFILKIFEKSELRKFDRAVKYTSERRTLLDSVKIRMGLTCCYKELAYSKFSEDAVKNLSRYHSNFKAIGFFENQ